MRALGQALDEGLGLEIRFSLWRFGFAGRFGGALFPRFLRVDDFGRFGFGFRLCLQFYCPTCSKVEGFRVCRKHWKQGCVGLAGFRRTG